MKIIKPEPYLANHVRTVLDASTAMVSRHTNDALQTDGSIVHEKLLYHSTEYGWIIYTGGLLDDEDRASLAVHGHDELLALIEYAYQRGFKYVELDCDSQPLPAECGLPTFEW